MKTISILLKIGLAGKTIMDDSNRPKKEREILEEFSHSEKGVDTTFERLPNRVREIALKKMALAKNETELILSLDRCVELREITGTKDTALVKAVDPILRYYRFLESK